RILPASESVLAFTITIKRMFDPPSRVSSEPGCRSVFDQAIPWLYRFDERGSTGSTAHTEKFLTSLTKGAQGPDLPFQLLQLAGSAAAEAGGRPLVNTYQPRTTSERSIMAQIEHMPELGGC